MGDSRRFDLFADRIASRFDATLKIADVAGGKGYLQAALYQRGFRDVLSWDRRRKYAKGNRGRNYRYGYFDFRSAPRDYDLVCGMHPDQGTDHIIQYALKHRKPFAVCPCCIMPSAVPYGGPSSLYARWCDHLIQMAQNGGFIVDVGMLPMRGRNVFIIGSPKKLVRP